MFCTQCGFETPEDGGFCPNCGAQQQPIVHPQYPKQSQYLKPDPRPVGSSPIATFFQRIPKNSLIIGVAALVVVIVVIVLLTTRIGSGGDRGGNYVQYAENAIYGFKDFDQDEVLFVTRTGLLKDTVPVDLVSIDNLYVGSGKVSDDRSVAAFKAKGDLQIVTTSDSIKVDQDLVGYFVLARSGRSVLYCATNDEEDVELICYDIGNKSSRIIATLASDETIDRICLSPDGLSVVYSILSDSKIVCYLSTNGGESKELGDYVRPIAISDGAKLVYYFKGIKDTRLMGSLNILKNGEEIHLLSDYSLNRLFFNRSYSEIVFTDNGKTYFCKNGNDPQKILNGEISDWRTPLGRGYLQADTFVGMVASSNEGIYYFGNQGNLEEIDISDGYIDSQISANDQSMLFVDDLGSLQIIRDLRQSLEPETMLENFDIFAVCANDDFSTIYFIDRDNELFYLNGSEPMSIADDVNTGNFCFDDNNALYFIADQSSDGSGQLCSSRNGSEKIEMEEASAVSSIGSVAGGIYYYNNNDDKTYFVSSAGQNIEIGDGFIYPNY